MKYNPKVAEAVVQTHKLEKLHPEQDEATAQGILAVLYDLSQILAEITGMSKITLQPAAGAQGELTGVLIIRAFHQEQGQLQDRQEILIPDSAHGTNPASAAMAGFKVVVIPSDEEGMVDLDALREAVGPKTAGFMITNPNTLGIFEKNILEIAKVVHESGGLLYYDGANFNAILGKVRPGDMGFDIVHLNIHKTFATPHGGGGPGAGPVGVTKRLERFLPSPLIGYDGRKYYLDHDIEKSIGKIRSYNGNIAVLVRAYAYILSLGMRGLETVGETAVLNTNYLLTKILSSGYFDMPYTKRRKHEFVLSAKRLVEKTGVRGIDIAKRILDFGIHSPTIYFPQIVEEAIMIEAPETESLEDLDSLAVAILSAAAEATADPEIVRSSPHSTSVSRIDEVKASHPKTIKLRWDSPTRKADIIS
jgi:glycine dehydrogenase subunit 2